MFPETELWVINKNSRMDQGERGMLPGLYVNHVRLHQRRTPRNRLRPALPALPQPVSKQAGGRGSWGWEVDDRNGLLLSLWPLITFARAALQWQSRELPAEVNFRLREVSRIRREAGGVLGDGAVCGRVCFMPRTFPDENELPASKVLSAQT